MFAENSGSPIAKIRIARSDGQVRVEVEDRGKGIPPEKLLEMASMARPEWESGECERGSGNWAVAWQSIPTATARVQS